MLFYYNPQSNLVSFLINIEWLADHRFLARATLGSLESNDTCIHIHSL